MADRVRFVQGGRVMKILIVDDEPLLLRTISRLLSDRTIANQEVSISPDCGGARERLSSTAFDFVLTDWNLGDGCGSDLFEEFGRSAASGSPTFAFMSGEASILLDTTAQRRLGCFVLPKPFGRRELIALVRKVSLTRGQSARVRAS